MAASRCDHTLWSSEPSRHVASAVSVPSQAQQVQQQAGRHAGTEVPTSLKCDIHESKKCRLRVRHSACAFSVANQRSFCAPCITTQASGHHQKRSMAMLQAKLNCRARPASLASRRMLAATPSRCVTRAAAAPAQAPSDAQKGQKAWYALVANTEFWFQDPQNEPVAEQLRERVRFFKETNQEPDFYLVPNPKWLDAKYPNEAKRVKRPCMALVTTDKQWAVFMKVRLDRVLRIDLPADMPESEVLAMGDSKFAVDMQGKWTAPYPRYAPGWWEVFYPKQQ